MSGFCFHSIAVSNHFDTLLGADSVYVELEASVHTCAANPLATLFISTLLLSLLFLPQVWDSTLHMNGCFAILLFTFVKKNISINTCLF